MRLGYLPQSREQHRIGAGCLLRLRQLRLHPTLLGKITPALGAFVQVHDRVIVGVAAELTIDEHADQVAKMSHDVASPGIRRTVRADRGVLIRGRLLRSGALCSSAARN